MTTQRSLMCLTHENCLTLRPVPQPRYLLVVLEVLRRFCHSTARFSIATRSRPKTCSSLHQQSAQPGFAKILMRPLRQQSASLASVLTQRFSASCSPQLRPSIAKMPTRRRRRASYNRMVRRRLSKRLRVKFHQPRLQACKLHLELKKPVIPKPLACEMVKWTALCRAGRQCRQSPVPRPQLIVVSLRRTLHRARRLSVTCLMRS